MGPKREGSYVATSFLPKVEIDFLFGVLPIKTFNNLNCMLLSGMGLMHGLFFIHLFQRFYRTTTMMGTSW